MIILLRVLNKVLGLYIGATFEIEKEDVPKEKYSFEANHITVTKEGYIYLTESGQKIAETIYERHQLLSSWLTTLGVDPKVAEEDACRIEHVISPESFEAIKKHVNRH